jgi:hypothetical protein
MIWLSYLTCKSGQASPQHRHKSTTGTIVNNRRFGVVGLHRVETGNIFTMVAFRNTFERAIVISYGFMFSWIWITIAKPCETVTIATMFAEHLSSAIFPDSWASIWLDELVASHWTNLDYIVKLS